MDEFFETVVVGLPGMFGHAAIAVALFIGGVLAYFRLTPYDDMKLVNEGNTAASISLFSIVVGLAIPLSFCLAQTSTLEALLLFGVITVAIQLFAFKICDWLLSDLPGRIERGEVSAAIVLLSVKLAASFFNSAMG